jgi:hypothetical protein
MGQYHHPVCIEAAEGLNAYDFDCGAKEGEMAFSRPSPLNVMVALVCARGGNMPADCSQSPLIGRWAGKRVLIQGDYAKDDDIPGWDGPPLSRLYSALTPAEDRKAFTAKDYPSASAEELRQWNEQLARTPVFADISREARDFLEAVCNVRYFDYEQKTCDRSGKVLDTSTGTGMVRVRPLARTYGGSGVAEYVLSPDYSEEDLTWLKQRKHLRPQDVMRPPRTGDRHGLTPDEIPEGQERVTVNLDTLEYLNPAKFGQVPTLAGMVSLAPKNRDLPILKRAHKEFGSTVVDVAGGLFVLLCHPQRRGGGDIPANAEEMVAALGPHDSRSAKRILSLFKGVEDIKGRWRDGRILGTSTHAQEDWPTTEEVIERGTDISDRVLKYLMAISHY